FPLDVRRPADKESYYATPRAGLQADPSVNCIHAGAPRLGRSDSCEVSLNSLMSPIGRSPGYDEKYGSKTSLIMYDGSDGGGRMRRAIRVSPAGPSGGLSWTNRTVTCWWPCWP